MVILKRQLDIYQKAGPEVLELNKKMGPNLFNPILKLKKKKTRLFTFLEIWKNILGVEIFQKQMLFIFDFPPTLKSNVYRFGCYLSFFPQKQ